MKIFATIIYMAKITIQAEVEAPVEKVWDLFNGPEHIVKWNHASDDWHTTRASNDLKVGGIINSRMESKDGTQGFDFQGTYDEVVPHEFISYSMADGRKVEIAFRDDEGMTHITETFDAETVNSIEMQRDGWQTILDNFKKYVESYK